MIPTAEELIKKWHKSMEGPNGKGVNATNIMQREKLLADAIREQNRLHVEAALKAASEKAKLAVIPYDQEQWEHVPNPLKASDLRDEDEMEDGEIEVDKESILSAYPLTNIK